MDLTTHTNFIVNWQVVDQTINLTFKDATDTTVLDTITIPTNRLRAFLDSLAEVAYVFSPPVDDTTRDYCTTSFINNKSRTSF
jgi:hypothetical protein